MMQSWNVRTRCLLVSTFLILAGSGCGDDDTPTDAGMEHGDAGQLADAGGINSDATVDASDGSEFVLQVGTTGPTATSDCLAYVADTWQVAPTEFTDLMGAPTNDDCVLVPILLTNENDGYWVSGSMYDIFLRTPQFDGDPVRHAISTTEDAIVAGSFDTEVFPREGDLDGTPLLSVVLTVGPYAPGNPSVWVSVE